MACGFVPSSFDLYHLSSDDEEYLISKSVPEMTTRQSNHAAHLFTAAWLYSNSPSEALKNRGQVNPKLKECHSDPMEISSLIWFPDIIDWWLHQGQMCSKYADFSSVAHSIFSLIAPGGGVEASFSPGRDFIRTIESKTTGKSVQDKIVILQFAAVNNGIFASNYIVLDTTNTENDLELMNEAEERILHRVAKVHNMVEMWQGSQNLSAIQKKACAQNKQRTAVGYIPDTEEIIKASWTNFQLDGMAAFKQPESSPQRPDLPAKDLPRW